MADRAGTAPSAHGAAPSGSPGDRGATVASVTKSFLGLQRTVRRSKARLNAAAGDDVESATQGLLHVVAAEGQRAGLQRALRPVDGQPAGRRAGEPRAA